MTFRIAFYVDSVPFTRAVVDGQSSLGGSESACVGLARALQARGHEVHMFATKLDADVDDHRDDAGVTWHQATAIGTMSQYVEWDLVCALRMAHFFAGDLVNARLRWIWNQDLLIGDPAQHAVMASMYQVDRIVYVSEYHRHQWERLLPSLRPFGWVTRNGVDPRLVPDLSGTKKRSHRVIHISRPERAMDPILTMWPEIRRRRPDAELALCRYNSMYDSGGWGKICASYDARVALCQAGGIVWLGELGKVELYRAIAESAVMWYPGIASFAETSCIAALEAQACGTPFVGSYRGALPETVPSGTLIEGDAERDPAYQVKSIEAVCHALVGCETQSAAYRAQVAAGLAWVPRYAFDVIAAEWEAAIDQSFSDRLETQSDGIITRLMHDDDPSAAMTLAPDQAISDFAMRVINGQDQSAEDYGRNALQDPITEGDLCERFAAVEPHFVDCRHLLDVACGNGAMALRLARHHAELHVHGIDYSAHNITVAREAAEALGISDRCTFEVLTIYDFERHELSEDWARWAAGRQFDGLFVGEFLEHVANTVAVVDGLEAVLAEGAVVVYTMPNGPLTELMPRGVPIHRGHVHRFADDDVRRVFGVKFGFEVGYVAGGVTQRSRPVGHWLVRYLVEPGRRARPRDLVERARRTRPYPRLSVGLIAKNADTDLGRCLASVWPIADEIVVGDCGSTDATVAIAEQYGARVLALDPVDAQPEGFAGARNAVLAACTGEWFLWIDADEVLTGAEHLSKYLDSGGPHVGYVIRQQHLYLDLPSSYDIPVRLFRRRPDIRFYGCIHEQPAMGDSNTEIFPALEVRDVVIAHYGYATEAVRKQKMFRNLPMLKRDTQVFPERVLGRMLVLRDYVNMADHERQTLGRWTARAAQWCATAVALWDQHFADPEHKYHVLARPYYEKALQNLHAMHIVQAVEMEMAMGGAPGGIGSRRLGSDRIWVRSAEEFRRIVEYKIARLAKDFEGPTVDTTPVARACERVGVVA